MPTLLIAETRKNQRALCQMELEEAGYRVIEAENGREALRVVREMRLDLVILDPFGQGFERVQVLREIKEMDAGPPVVIYTGYALHPDDPYRHLADAWVTKSSDLAPLKQAIEGVLHQKINETSGVHEAEGRGYADIPHHSRGVIQWHSVTI